MKYSKRLCFFLSLTCPEKKLLVIPMSRIFPLILICVFFTCFSFGQSVEQSELETIIQTKSDSLKNRRLHDFIYRSYVKKQWDLFHKARKIHLKFSKKRKDSASYANTLEFTGSYFQNHAVRPDSAFYYFTKSKHIYQRLKDSSGIGRTLLNNAILRKNIHDYAGSIATSFESLKYINPNQQRSVASAYNNLGISFNQQKDSADAIKYHLKSLTLREKLTKYPHLKLQSINNLAKVYKDIAHYSKAIDLLEPFIKDSNAYKKHPKTYAMMLDNYGHALFLYGKKKEGSGAMETALNIRKKIAHKDGIVINKIHLAEYYLWEKDTTKVISFARSANVLAKQILNYRDYLASMKFLADVYKGDDSKKLYQKYNHVKDSLALADRRHKDLFNQFEFELDEKQNELLTKDKKLAANQYIFIGIGIIAFLGIILFMIHRLKIRKLKKQFEKGFRQYLIDKYNLSSQNIEFWEAWLLDLKPKELSEKLFISIDAVKSRRQSLRDKVYKIQKLEGNFTQSRAIRIYNQELENFKNHS
ncbi:tetratricopeptide repeat protein [Pseudotenacibaculum haliotis]|uniref:Tetratricopeptide repeat protein n=1 Tax=Pseudotenacibaculum haliotis TaxID=1862138 RepID=A0ABW5LNY8_9FLAO